MCSNNIIFKLAWQKIDIPAAHFSLVRVTRFGFLSFCYKIRKIYNKILIFENLVPSLLCWLVWMQMAWKWKADNIHIHYYIHYSYYENSEWWRACSQYSIIACEADMITQYLEQILSHHVKFKVCLVSKHHVCVLFLTFANLERSAFFCRFF